MPPKKRKPDIDFTLRRVFQKSAFRSVQRQVIEAALEGHDVYLQAATGLGKSLCFQLPAVQAEHGITIVVSPLLSIMSNQVDALIQANVKAAALNSTVGYEEKLEIFKDLECGHPTIRLLYVTPELCTTQNFRSKLAIVYKQRELNRIVIDEAHCISEWGHDFRPSFKQLSMFKTEYPLVPVTAVTATATGHVREDIISILRLPPPPTLKMFLLSTARSNLHYEVRFKNDQANILEDFLGWLKGVHKRRHERCKLNGERADAVSGIIYCQRRQTCEELAATLRDNGIGAKSYHAGMTNDEKEEVSRSWQTDKPGYDVIVATTAFGMGIDKLNVRFVVHWQIAKSFEGYYQEAGRAGRDGKAARCILYYSREDRDRTQYLVNLEASRKKPNADETIGKIQSFAALVAYCEDTDHCRHQTICKYFGDQEEPRCDNACDYCKDKEALKKAKRLGLAEEEWVSTQREEGAYRDYYHLE
ncbi:P-loop containing nucleoside triphosphate hydrolase protein [Kalaharituber pfeilii]|nr:P-loop containing nucleoside triphosphate hydrolase protein [Kalaharituber pfeilii]